MSDYVIVDHHHDPHAEVYRLTIGVREQHAFAEYNEDGSLKLEPQKDTVQRPKRDPVPRKPKRDAGGDIIMDKDGVVFEDAEGPGYTEWEEYEVEHDLPVRTQQEVITPVEEFVWVAFDERWAGKTPEAIADEQRREVKRALRRRDRAVAAAEEAAAARTTLPGIGEDL